MSIDTNTLNICLRTVDPEHTLDDQPVAALTTLLHKVCGNDPEKFEEACRLVDLFILEALKK